MAQVVLVVGVLIASFGFISGAGGYAMISAVSVTIFGSALMICGSLFAVKNEIVKALKVEPKVP